MLIRGGGLVDHGRNNRMLIVQGAMEE